MPYTYYKGIALDYTARNMEKPVDIYSYCCKCYHHATVILVPSQADNDDVHDEDDTEYLSAIYIHPSPSWFCCSYLLWPFS